MRSMPLVSIIMPCYNASEIIGKSIESVLNQTYSNWELLITNDCSKDNSEEIVRNYMVKDDRIKLYTLEKNSGVAAARNNSINYAKGDYIAFLDSDDIWFATKLERQVELMCMNNVQFCYTAYRKIDNEDAFISKPIHVSDKGIDYKQLLKHNEMGCLTVIMSREALGDNRMVKVGHEDYVLWLSILRERGIKAYGINEVLAGYRVGNESISSNKLKAAGFTWNIYRNIEKLNLLKSCYFFSNYALRAFLKYIK